MSTGIAILKVSLKNAFAYRSSVIFNIIGSVFTMFISLALWKYVYRYQPDMTSYMILYVIVSNVIRMFYNDSMSSEIGSKISDGSFALELIRPVHFLKIGYFRMLGRMTAELLMKGIPVILLFSPLIVQNRELIHFRMLGVFVLAVFLGHILFTILFSLIGFCAFICLEIWPFERLMRDTIRFLSGSFIPLALFPSWLKTLSAFLPFRYLYSFPIELLLGGMPTDEIRMNIMLMLVWIVLLGGLLAYLYKTAVKQFVVQGG